MAKRAVVRSWKIALTLSFLIGPLGVDRFYLGKYVTGILKLLTLGGFVIWWIVDLILIATKSKALKNVTWKA